MAGMQSDALRADREHQPALQLVVFRRKTAPRQCEAVEDDFAALAGGLQQVGAPDETGDEAGARPGIERRRRVDLLDAPVVHHRDPVGGDHGLALVVGDIDRGDLEGVMQAADLEPHLLAQAGIEVG